MIKLRFVHCPDPISDAVLLDTGGLYSHVEAVTSEGKYLGAHSDGGVQARLVGYDKFDRELFVSIPASDMMTTRFYSYLNTCIGEPYDFGAIAGFVSSFDLHQKHKVICSALQTLALRGCGWFATPLSQPAHKISPRDLLLIISGKVPV